MSKYTDEDVARLIKVASWVSDEYKDSNSDVRQLYDALAPFRPDPEEELIAELKRICYEYGSGEDGRWLDMISAVREYDAKESK